MKSRLYHIAALIIVMLLSGSCGKKKIPAGSPEEVAELLGKYSGQEEILQLYTRNTLDQFNRLVKVSGIDRKKSYSILSFIPQGAETELITGECAQDRCSISIKFITHPVENMKGYTIDLILNRENDTWKINRENDFKKMADKAENSGAEDYFKNLRVD